MFNAAVANSFWSVITGKRAELKDENGMESEILKSSCLCMEGLQQAQRSGLLFAPFLRHIIPDQSGWSGLMKATTCLQKLCRESVAEHATTLDHNCPRDLVDHYLIKIAETTDKSSSFYKETGMKNLQANVTDLFIAGNEPTSAELCWILLYLSCHPDVQKKAAEEIEKVVGRSRLVSGSDRPSLPYTEAVILEVLRITAEGPLGLPRRMLEDKMFHGYFLPKHTIIIANIESALLDPEYWGDPETFRPERFLSEDGTKVVRSNDALILFTHGKRQCVGKSLAEETMFLFTSNILQKFQILPDPEKPETDLEPVEGFAKFPKPFRIVMKDL